MAKRPIFIVSEDPKFLYIEKEIEFEWFAGLSVSQKQKSVNSLHNSAKLSGYDKILEVSTKSENSIGKKLSAFNLSFPMSDGKLIYLESAFQGSKIFENGGPYNDLYSMEPFDIKKEDRISKENVIKGFKFDGIEWDSEPKTAFYDWLYINAVFKNIENNGNEYKKILEYNAFTDIEFNPLKSINCQARSCAVYVSLYKQNILEDALESKESFIKILLNTESYNINIQEKFFPENP
tara:strand:- start:47 stop:754 length:708 start_codon:yes stop_codon:yes gene_type:complete